MTDSLCRKRKLADSIIPCVLVHFPLEPLGPPTKVKNRYNKCITRIGMDDGWLVVLHPFQQYLSYQDDGKLILKECVAVSH